MKELKKQLRKQIAQEKRRHGITELITKSAALLEKLEQHPKFASARTVLLYYSLDERETANGRKDSVCERKTAGELVSLAVKYSEIFNIVG